MKTAIYTHPDCKRHRLGDMHRECPERIQAIEGQLIADGLDRVLDYRTAPNASIADLARVHLPDTIDMVREASAEGEGYTGIGDLLVNTHSWNAALRAAGSGIAAVDALMAGEIHNAFCLVRPIGHHATPSTPMGFCLFNNVAIAAQYALKVHGMERLAIIDIDVHHGNGTDDAFAYVPQVMMCSFYQTFLYPFSGNERVRAHMVNVPLNAGSDGTAVRKLVNEQWLPALHFHQPQMIFISAGFDAHRDDPLGDLELLEDDYAWITQQIMSVADQYADGRIISFLEGGYNLTALAKSAAAHIRTLARQD